jgi:hypothetical protein
MSETAPINGPLIVPIDAELSDGGDDDVVAVEPVVAPTANQNPFG